MYFLRNESLYKLWLFFLSKMINFSQPDTIDERAINKKKLTHFTVSVSTAQLGTCHRWKSKIFFNIFVLMTVLLVEQKKLLCIKKCQSMKLWFLIHSAEIFCFLNEVQEKLYFSCLRSFPFHSSDLALLRLLSRWSGCILAMQKVSTWLYTV